MLPFFTKERQCLGLTVTQKALAIFDVFTCKMTTAVMAQTEVIEIRYLIVVNDPPNMIKYYEVFNLTIKRYTKTFSRKKFNIWYAK